MNLVENIEFPSKYLDCYEAVLITILKYMGLPDEKLMMGTQAYFYFSLGTGGARILPRYNQIPAEWERVFSLSIKSMVIENEASLRDQLISKLESEMPVCLPVDLFWLPYTPHYQRLHQTHFINIFGYEHERYYVICPYYRFEGWVDAERINKGFFELEGRLSRNIIVVPAFELKVLTDERVQGLIQESCQNMLGLRIPAELTGIDPKYLGLSGISTLASYLKQKLAANTIMLRSNDLLDLSRHLMSVGNSRYWFHKLMEQHQGNLISRELTIELQNQFGDIVSLWRGIGRMLGASVHTDNPEKIESVIMYLGKVYDQEKLLFNGLLGALPDYEEGLI